MKIDIKSLLKNKMVLYIVLFLAITNVLGYLMTGNIWAVVLFALSGVATTYFSKNMIVVLLVALVITSFFLGTKTAIRITREGMKNKKKAEDGKKKKGGDDGKKDGKKKEKTTYFGYPSPTDPKNDYTRHKDKTRRNRYIWRHMKDTRTGDPTRAGYLSLYVLWNKPSLKASITDYKKRLGKYNRTGTFPLDISGYQKPANAKTKIQRSK